MTDQSFNHFQDGGVPIKAWTKGVPVEPAAHQQLVNLSRMPFAYKHLAVMPDVHLGKGATIGSVIATEGAVIPAAVGVDLGCFRGDTKIPLLDGTQATLVDLERRGESFWVYSIDSNKRIAPGKAMCVKTRSSAELIRVVVSGGEEIICTPDHEFMLSDGTYKEARNLVFNDSLMPLYRRWQTRDGYESVNNGKGTQKMTHLAVWEAIHGPVPKGHVVHHRNHIHFDNRPDNLELMTASGHSSHHRKTGRGFDNADPAFQALKRAGIARRANDPIQVEKMIAVGTENITRYMKKNPEHFAASVAGNGIRGAQYLAKFNTTERECGDCGAVEKNPAALRWHKKREHGYNHKVLLVESLDERADVYCLQVEEHHNFALSAGVFVHNCGMMAVRTSLTASDLPDDLHPLRSEIERVIPHGRTNNGQRGDRGAWGAPSDHLVDLLTPHARALDPIIERHAGLGRGLQRIFTQAGTLGTGNHFVEVCLDLEQQVWIMLHSGSRGIGNAIGTYFIQKAKDEMRRWFINLPDQDLAYLPEGSDHYGDYLEAVSWAQDYALLNRQIMMTAALGALERKVPKPFGCTCSAVNCHHNYVSTEKHFGKQVLVTRKGAVSAQDGELGIIPGSMGAKSFIVRGRGNKESFCSCSHGAGRVMSRTEAKRRFTAEDHIAAVAGVECRTDADVIDETPAAYKPIEAVMAAQTDLVDVVHELKQVLCVKG